MQFLRVLGHLGAPLMQRTAWAALRSAVCSPPPMGSLRCFGKKSSSRKSPRRDSSASTASSFDLTRFQPLFDVGERASDRLQDAVSALKRSVEGIQIGRADPKLFENLVVEKGKESFSVKNVSQVLLKNQSQVQISVFDPKYASSIVETIQNLNIGASPVLDNKDILVNILKPTKEFRQQKVKLVKQCGEECKSRLRRVRKTILDDLKGHEKESSEDEVFEAKKAIQSKVDELSEFVDSLCDRKESELMR